MQIVIVGAGIAGLASAKVLTQAGFDVVVLDRTPDVGGVWSATRRYPGLCTQNSKHTYRFADFPMPASYPEVPTAQQMQDYLAEYVERFGFGDRIRLHTEVIAASPSTRGWTLAVRDVRTGDQESIECDHLVVANGVFCDPATPAYPGEAEFAASGGWLCAPSQFHHLDEARDRHVVVVGYGKSACDIAEAVSQVATSTTVVARRLLWKMPHQIRGIGAAEDLMLTRLGEASFHYIEPNRFERLYNGRGRRIRDAVFDVLQWRVSRQLGLSELGLVPAEDFEHIARSNASMVTEGFYEQVAAGRITVHRSTTITRLGARAAVLSTGQSLQADIVLCATGFRQRVPFLDHSVQERLVDSRGNFRLYRQILPLDIPHLTFAGYNSSLTSSLNAEIGAVWTVGLLTGNITLPPKEEMVRHVERRLRWMEHRTMGHHAAGTSIIPFSIHNIDELLADLSIDIGPFTRARQWVRRIQPQSYQQHLDRFITTCGWTNPHAAPAVAEYP